MLGLMARAVVKFAAKVLQSANIHKKQQYCYLSCPMSEWINNNIVIKNTEPQSAVLYKY
jgi:hypothetical protein